MLKKIKFKKEQLPLAGVILATILFDQLSKWLVMAKLLLNEDGTFKSIAVANSFNLVMVWNRGVSFGMFNGVDASWILVVLSLVISIALFVWMLVISGKFEPYALALIIGGALGNVIDRGRFGAVVDFIDLYIGDYHWPAFNVADSCISFGAAVMIFLTLRENRGKTNEKHK